MRHFKKAILIAGAVFCLSLSAFSQNISLNANDITVKEAMEQLKKSTGYSFVFSSTDVNTKKRITFTAQNATIEEIITQILNGQEGLSYDIQGKNIIVKKTGIQPSNKSERKISGRILDTNNEPVIGASIQIEGTSKGTVSDLDGNFSLNVEKGNTLVISFIGYKRQYIDIKEQKTLAITMREDSEILNDVVVIGYGSVSKKELTSAVSHVSNKDLLQIGSSNPAMQIQGKVSGVAVDNSHASDPNSSPSIQIRGVSSRTAGLGPLIVIDGVPGGSLDNVNENDIESIDILKDGAASAIYGTRGSNGVIVITTKKGSTDGQIHTSYSGFVNIITPIRELQVLNAEEFKAHKRGDDYGYDTDWFGELTQIGVSHSHTLQITGGNAKTNYKATVDYKNTDGIDIRSGRKEIGARLSLNHTGKSGLYNITLNAAPRTINFDDSDYNVFSYALLLNPTMPVMNPEDVNKYIEINIYGTNNPVEILKLEESGGERKILNWDGTFKLNLLPLLGHNDNHYLSSQITIAQQIDDTDYSWFRSANSTICDKSGFQGEASRKYDKSKQESLEWLVNYGFDNKNHHIKFMGGYSYQYFVNDGLNAENKNFASDLLGANNLGAGTYNSDAIGRLGMGSYKNDSKLIAFFGRLSYNLKDKYFATFSLRHEGSSKFGANHKWGSFPAVSAGWRISEEKFMQRIKWIDDLKIRGDYGVTGNQDFDSYQSLATMAGFDLNYYKGQNIKGWGFNTNPNPDLRWEKGKNWNVGIDFSLFNYKLNGSINYYSRKQQDLLGNYNVPMPPNGIATSFVNVGTMKNTGIEIELSWNAVHNKDFDYTIGFVGSTSNNKFVSFSNEFYQGQSFYWIGSWPMYPNNPGQLQQIEEGSRIGDFHGFEYAGLDEQGNWLIKSKENEIIPISEGTEEDKKVIGNGLPKFTMSMTHTFNYKAIDLSLFFRGNFGFQIYDAHDMYYGLQSAATNSNVLESAYKENKDITTGTAIHNSYFVHNGNFLKLDVATLGYTWNINSKWIDKIRFYMTARNLFTISGYHRGLDKDSYSVNGLEPGIPYNITSYYPASRQYLFGVQLHF